MSDKIRCRTFISCEGEAESDIKVTISELGNIEIYTELGEGAACIELSASNAMELSRQLSTIAEHLLTSFMGSKNG